MIDDMEQPVLKKLFVNSITLIIMKILKALAILATFNSVAAYHEELEGMIDDMDMDMMEGMGSLMRGKMDMGSMMRGQMDMDMMEDNLRKKGKKKSGKKDKKDKKDKKGGKKDKKKKKSGNERVAENEGGDA